MNILPPPADIDFDDLLKQGLAQVLMRADNELLMAYHLGSSSVSDRRADAAWPAAMFSMLAPEQTIVCPGAGRDCRADPGAERARGRDPGRADQLPRAALCRDPVRAPHCAGAHGQARDGSGRVRGGVPRAWRAHGVPEPDAAEPDGLTMPECRRKELAGRNNGAGGGLHVWPELCRLTGITGARALASPTHFRTSRGIWHPYFR